MVRRLYCRQIANTLFMPYTIQLLLPLYDNSHQPFGIGEFARVRRELTDQFGGVTAYTRSPAEGFWEDDEGRTRKDEIITVEVMVEEIDRRWWNSYGKELAVRFRQEEMVIRAVPFDSLNVRIERDPPVQ